MTWTIDHLAIVAHDLPRSIAFYEDIFEMEDTPFEDTPNPNVPLIPRGTMLDRLGSSIHIVEAVPNFHCRFPKIGVNPTLPHLAVTTDEDVEAVKARLDAIEWDYLSPQDWGPVGYRRLYTTDPCLNTMEANQVVDASAAQTGHARVRGDSSEDAVNGVPWTLDHVTFAAFDVGASAKWWGNFLGIEPSSVDEDAALFLEVGTGRGVTFSSPDWKSGRNGWWVSTAAHSQLQLSVSDLDGVRRRLEKANIHHDASSDALRLHDPSMNTVQAVQQSG